MKRRRVWIAIVVVVLIPVLVPLVTLPRARRGILASLQGSLGRRVQAQAVHLTLFPRPGVVLDNVRLADDPAFGLEDMVMADSASASINLWDLLRGRIVFSRIHLASPSINLVRDDAGYWNLAALLEGSGAGQQPGARAGSTGTRPASAHFPYVDWDHARVNFKFHQIKTHFYLDQVSGSLAREGPVWRLQVQFVPARSDLNLSNTGVVTLDGRWRAAPGNGRPAQFDLALHLRDSYLAGSSALLLGHDAGVHGVLAAAVRILGTEQSFAITGTATAVSLRRWDMLPPPAQVSFAFAARYLPSLDELDLQGLGDPGWHHVQLEGTVRSLFNHPRVNLQARLSDFGAAGMLPLVLALKPGLPADLQLAGEVNGQAHVHWQAGQRSPQGSAEVRFTGFLLSSGGAALTIPAAALTGSGQGLWMLSTAAELRAGPGPATPLRAAGEVNPGGFSLQWESPRISGAGAGELARLLGVHVPWPAMVEGYARLHMRLAAPWAQARQAAWSGTATFARARFQPSGSSGVELRPLEVSFGSPLRARFHLEGLPVQGAMSWSAAEGAQFQLTGQHVASAGIWSLLHPAPGDLMQRMFGAVLGAPAPPPWLRRLRARGTVRLRPMLWHGIPVNVQLQLEAAPGSWRASGLVLGMAQGAFGGSGSLEAGEFDIRGAVAATRPLLLAPLLAPTPFRGALTGRLSGDLRLTRPLSGGDLRHLLASGDFLVRAGSLRTASGRWPFQSCRGHYRLGKGVALVTGLACVAAGRRYRGSGQAQFAPATSLSYDIRLHDGATTLHLFAPAAPGGGSSQ